MPQSSGEATRANGGRRAIRRGPVTRLYVSAALIVAATLPTSRAARADCTTTSPPTETSCTRTTINQGSGAPGTNAGADGFGFLGYLGTVTVFSGASVTGNANAGSRGVFIGEGTVINNAGGTITGVEAGVAVNGTGSLEVINSGSIQASHLGVYGQGQVTVTNYVGGTIAGDGGGVYGNSVNLANYGTITSANSGGAGALVDGTITNHVGGTITGYGGVSISQVGLVNNYGTIFANGAVGARGVYVGANSTVNNYAGATITSLASSDVNSGGVVVNSNSVINNMGTINATLFGIHAYFGGVSVYNSGTIAAATDAIYFEGAGNTLTLAPGSSITGNVDGYIPGNTFQLGGSGTASFDIGQLAPSGQYRNFGTFNKVGDSTWTLTGTSSFAGPANVNGGTLAVNGDITSMSSVFVNAGGTLGGTGTVGNVAVTGGTLAPGNSIGTLTIAGSLSFTAASAYLVQVSGAASDRTIVTGTATVAGRVSVDPLARLSATTTYTIINAGSLSGSFDSASVTNNFARNARLSYVGNDVLLTLDPGLLVPIVPGSATNNQSNVAAGIDNALLAGVTTPAGFNALFALSGPELLNALTQASGESATGSQQTTFNAMSQFMGVLTDPFVGGRSQTATSSGASSYAAEDGGRKMSPAQRDAYL
ncbi:hypothetical protein BH11PSE4_BH11PSE4_41010 [soil metagenome]